MIPIYHPQDLARILTTAQAAGPKDALACSLQAHAGIRTADLPFLRLGMFDFREGMIRFLFRTEFSGYPRELPMTEALERRAYELIKSGGLAGVDALLFPEPDWQLRTRNLIRASGVELSAVGLRRSYCVYCLRRLADRPGLPGDLFPSCTGRRRPPLVTFNAVTQEQADDWFTQ